ncbi:hypothetical protein [Acidipropionibacterium timonense]|uniref:hypothetical protein n=1 Tax=Acidipropionibacterium timonense TaxID=2161818 RepID=UPI0010304763|nr:hypothetical protein [Acidipropionibacterium timonense]
MAQRRIVTTDRAGIIWHGITWAATLLFVFSGLAAMLVQTLLPANLGYPQLHSPGVPDWVTIVVIGAEILAFLIPPIIVSSCGRKAARLGHPARQPVIGSWLVFAVVTVLVITLGFLL